MPRARGPNRVSHTGVERPGKPLVTASVLAEFTKAEANEAYYLRTYGISATEYGVRLRDQRGGCAICGSIPKPDKALAVDHDHTTGEVRGLLCTRCNLALGLFKDKSKLLKRAAKYLSDSMYPDQSLSAAENRIRRRELSKRPAPGQATPWSEIDG